jgi:hypothetical protein
VPARLFAPESPLDGGSVDWLTGGKTGPGLLKKETGRKTGPFRGRKHEVHDYIQLAACQHSGLKKVILGQHPSHLESPISRPISES